MKLQQLKYMLAIVDNGLNITAAAEKLFTSQPGVLHQPDNRLSTGHD
jgi:LysR family cys regulon transcriptional activator